MTHVRFITIILSSFAFSLQFERKKESDKNTPDKLKQEKWIRRTLWKLTYRHTHFNRMTNYYLNLEASCWFCHMCPLYGTILLFFSTHLLLSSQMNCHRSRVFVILMVFVRHYSVRFWYTEICYSLFIVLINVSNSEVRTAVRLCHHYVMNKLNSLKKNALLHLRYGFNNSGKNLLRIFVKEIGSFFKLLSRPTFLHSR